MKILLFVVVVAVVVFILLGTKGGGIETQKVDFLTMHDILMFFKRPEVFQELKSDANLLAVAIKETQNDGKTAVTACLFDKTANAIRKKIIRWIANSIDSDLQNAFGDKSMIVLQ